MIRAAQAAEEAYTVIRTGRHALEVSHEVVCIPLSLVNAYLVGPAGAPDRTWILVDAGLWTSEPTIVEAAADWFGPDSRPGAIVLTHGHFDHVGVARRLAERWDAPIFAHEQEMPYLTGRSSYPPPDPAVGGGAMSFLSRFYPRGPFDLRGRIRPLPADGSIPILPEWRWIHTPGHAPGHVVLFRDSDRTLLAGDAFVTQVQESALSVLTRSPVHVHRPPAYFTPDWAAARKSVESLTWLRPEVAATGHGLPMYGELLREQLERLVLDWDDLVPAHGRYVRQAAVTGPEGVIRVPPAVVDPQLAIVAGVGLAALLGLAIVRHASRRDEESWFS